MSGRPFLAGGPHVDRRDLSATDEVSTAPERSTLVLASLIIVAAVANLNLSVANVALPSIGAGVRLLADGS